MSSTDGRDLADLARRALSAAWDGDPRAARLAAAEFAASGHAGAAVPPEGLEEELHGAYHGLRRSVAEALGMEEAAHSAAMAWTGWAMTVGNAAHELRARARLAVDEANRWRFRRRRFRRRRRLRRPAGDGARAAGPEGDASPATSPPALVDAMQQTESAASMVRRRTSPSRCMAARPVRARARKLSDAVTLIDARRHAMGDLPAAARLCASAARASASRSPPPSISAATAVLHQGTTDAAGSRPVAEDARPRG